MKTFRIGAFATLVSFLFAAIGFAQSSGTATISTYAGRFVPVNGAQAVTQAIDVTEAVVTDGAGGIYFASAGIGGVFHVAADGTLRMIAGTGVPGFSGDGGPASSAQLDGPAALALDSAGNLFIADRGNRLIRKVTPAGIISTVASFGTSFPDAVAVDAAGNLFVALGSRNQVHKVSPGGTITLFAGQGTQQRGFSGDGGPATAALLDFPGGMIVDPGGNLLIADRSNHRIRSVSPAGIINTVVGSGSPDPTQRPDGRPEGGFSGDGGPAISARFNLPSSLVLDAAGNLFIADLRNHRIRKVDSAGIVTTVAGNGAAGFGGDGGAATSANLSFPASAAVDATGNIFIADQFNRRIRKVSAAGIISTIAGNGTLDFSGEGGPATLAQITVRDVAADSAGNVFIADIANERVRKVSPDGIITTAVGTGISGFSGDGGPAASAQLAGLSALAIDAADNLFIATNGRIRKVTTDGIIRTVAGDGTRGFGGGGGPATSAQLGVASGLAVDAAGNLFIADSGNGRLYKVDTAGIITSIAGGGTGGIGIGDGGPATAVQFFNGPQDVAVDAAGNIFIADTTNSRIRKLTPDGIITTVAGTTRGFSGDGAPATSAQIALPAGVAVDAAGNLFIADTENNRIRHVSAAGIITTLAGTGTGPGTGPGGGFGVHGFGGDGGPAASAQIDRPRGVALDPAGNLYITDTGNSLIRKVTFSPPVSFSMSDRGGTSLVSAGTSAVMARGYARIQANPGSTTPSGVAIFGFRQNGVLISEAGVPASPRIQNGRIYAEVSADASLNTGIAVANPTNSDASISFEITNTAGTIVKSGSFLLGANKQRSAFLDADPFLGPKPVQGTLSFSSNVPISVIALRTFVNERSEFLMTTLPVVDTSLPPGTGTQVIPHFAVGAGMTTHILLVNPADSPMSGTVQFFSQGGAPTNVSIGGQVNSSFPYSVVGRSSMKLSTAGTASLMTQGSVRVIPTAGGSTPVPLVVFTYKPGAFTLSEAGVPVNQGTAFRMYVQVSGALSTPGNIETGFAIANTSTAAATVTLELTNLDGTTAGLPAPVTRPLPGSGQIVGFLSSFFSGLPSPFRGVLRISTPASGISVVGIRSRYNENGSYMMTTTPPTNEAAPPSSAEMLFPHIVDGGGFTTEFILFSGQAGQASSGTMDLYSDSGGAMNPLLR